MNRFHTLFSSTGFKKYYITVLLFHFIYLECIIYISWPLKSKLNTSINFTLLEHTHLMFGMQYGTNFVQLSTQMENRTLELYLTIRYMYAVLLFSMRSVHLFSFTQTGEENVTFSKKILQYCRMHVLDSMPICFAQRARLLQTSNWLAWLDGIASLCS